MTNIKSLMLYMLTLVVTRMEYREESDLESWYRVMQVIMAVHLRFQLAKDAKACYKMNRLVLVNLDILDEYLETFHIEDEEFYK